MLCGVRQGLQLPGCGCRSADGNFSLSSCLRCCASPQLNAANQKAAADAAAAQKAMQDLQNKASEGIGPPARLAAASVPSPSSSSLPAQVLCRGVHTLRCG